jgi:hypothetical protein
MCEAAPAASKKQKAPTAVWPPNFAAHQTAKRAPFGAPFLFLNTALLVKR